MVNVAICGATGYAGLELIKILLKHPKVSIKTLAAKIDKPSNISDIFPELKARLDMVCSDLTPDKILKQNNTDVVFLALPHGVSMEYAPKFLENGKLIIDLSADFRLKDAKVYERYYGQRHTSIRYLFASVYGLPELHSAKIKKARLIANPGCYPTGAILAVAPLLAKKMAKTNGIIIDSKSGTTGAGRRPDISLSFAEVNGSVKPYRVGVHQHTPEIEQELSDIAQERIALIFTPHLIPISRGILTTAYVGLKTKIGVDELLKTYRQFYKNAPFIRLYDKGVLPQIKDVANTNYCDIGITVSPDKKTAIIISVIDNLQKGASGQAVQNMNIRLNLPETLGLM